MAERALQLSLRPANLGDCRRIWLWRNEPTTREESFNSTPIPFSAHAEWFRKRLRDATTRIFIVLQADVEPVGYVRFDLDDDTAEVSISIGPAHRGQGIGSWAIHDASRQFLADEEGCRVRSLIARIKRRNAASIRAFQRAGFSFSRSVDTEHGEVVEMVYPAQTPLEVMGDE